MTKSCKWDGGRTTRPPRDCPGLSSGNAVRHSSPSITDRRWNSVHNFLKLAEEPPGSLRGRRTLPCSNQVNTALMSGSSRCADRNSAPPPLSEYTGTGSVWAPSAGGEWSDTSTEATAQSPAEGASGSTKLKTSVNLCSNSASLALFSAVTGDSSKETGPAAAGGTAG
ncbi:unnamed protein product [Boreogadus saida]